MMRETILLVEDNADDEALMILALRRAAVDVDLVVTRDGDEALHYLFANNSHDGPPLLVVTDLKLSKVNGLELLRRIRSHATTRSLPVVVLSSSMEDSDVRCAYDLAANGYFRKPMDFGQLHDLARELASCWLDAAPAGPPIARHGDL